MKEKVDDFLISVIIPAYNAEKYINRCISSVLKQTYKFYEIIIVNDGSTDRTKEICEKFVGAYKGFTLINSENRGVSGARNLGLQKASGRYVFFLDADDMIFPDALETLATNVANTDWVIGNFVSYNQKMRTQKCNLQYFQEKIHKGIPDELPELVKSRNFHFVWGKLYDKNIIKEKGLLFDRSYNYGEDLLFNLNYFIHINNFVVTQKVVYKYYYQLDSGLSHSVEMDEWKIQKCLCENVEETLNMCSHLKDDTKEKMNHFYYSQCIASVERAILLKDNKKIYEILSSQYFQKVLKQEKNAGRIKKIDYILLKNHFGKVYYTLHKIYVFLKETGSKCIG